MSTHYEKDRTSGNNCDTNAAQGINTPKKITADDTITYATGETVRNNIVTHENKKWRDIISFDVIDAPEEVKEWGTNYLNKTYKDGKYYIFGRFKTQERTTKNLINRNAITLDLDGYNNDKNRPLPPFSDMVAHLKNALKGAAFGIYTTFSSTPDYPKYRVVIPLSEPVSPDKYKGVAERVTQIIGTNMVDPASYKPAQAMYSPRCFSFNEHTHKSEFIEGVPINIPLKEAIQTTVIKLNPRGLDGRPRPLEKADPTHSRTEAVRFFCKKYDITTAIDTFLQDVYKRENPNTYKFIPSKSVGGLKIYKYSAFSHHQSDPAYGKNCNAFELVCFHKFGDPSLYYKEMADFVFDLPEIKEIQQDELKQDFKKKNNIKGDVDSWFKGIEKDSKGKIKSTISNFALLLENDQNLNGRIRRDIFANKIEVKVDKITFKPSDNWRPINNNDISFLKGYLEKKYKISSEQKFNDGFRILQMKTAYHPVKRFLEGLPAKLPEKPKIPQLFVELLGADDNAYIWEVTKKWFVAAVRRIYEPGCPWDTVPSFISETQGTGKSSTLRHLSGGYFTDSPGDFNKIQRVAEGLNNVWIAEIGEMAATRYASKEVIKQTISRRFDRCRAAWGKMVDDNPRQSVFFGTTNNLGYLNDNTGNRRHWPIKVHEVKLQDNPTLKKFLNDDKIVRQIWSEAMYYYEQEFKKKHKGNQNYFELSDEAAIIAEEEQLKYDYSAMNPRLGLVDKWITKGKERYNAKGEKEYVKAPEKICFLHIHCDCFGKDLGEYDARRDSKEYGGILKQLGYKRNRHKGEVLTYGKQYYYTKTKEEK